MAETIEENLSAAVQSVEQSAHRLASTAKFLERPVFMAQLVAGVEHGLRQQLSPWLDPAAAAEYSFSSESFVYLMATPQPGTGKSTIKRYGGKNMPRFLKSEIDAAIREGRWCSLPADQTAKKP